MKVNALIVTSAISLLLASEYTNAMQNPEMNQNSSNQNLQQAQGTSGNNAVFAVAATFQALRPFLGIVHHLVE